MSTRKTVQVTPVKPDIKINKKSLTEGYQLNLFHNY